MVEIARQPTRGQLFIHNAFGHRQNHGKNRNAYEHAAHTKVTAHNNNGYKNAKSGKTGGISEDFRPDVVAVQLLNQNNQKDGKNQLFRLGNQYNKACGNGSDNRAKHRDHIGDAYDNGKQGGVGNTENQKHKKRKNTDN